MKIGVIADDFTGASDIALTLAEGGMRTTQFVGVPDEPARGVEAGVVALKSRTVPASEARDQSLKACDWLVQQGAGQIIFKICSTFDSTADGNIGPVAAALAAQLGETHVITCPAFPENGRSVYQGHLFVGDRLLNESGMQDHPLTPMKDADLRRVLAAQTDWPVTHLSVSDVQQGAEVLLEAIAALPRSMIIVDAISNDDLRIISTAARGRKLLTGGSGIAIGLPANHGFQAGTPEWDAQDGPGAVLSGSCSRATRNQVERYCAIAPAREITAEEVMQTPGLADQLATWTTHQKTAPLLYTSADPKIVADAQAHYGQTAIANAIEQLFSDLAVRLVDAGITRLIVAGGETSGAVVEGLGAHRLRIGPRLAAGVPALKVEHRNLSLALKSGNFGEPDFFAHALRAMASPTPH